MKTLLIAAGLSFAFMAAPAFADCVGDLAKVEEAMKTATLDEANTKKSKELMDKATAAQTAKDDAACMAAAKDLWTLYGIKS